jgi:hypothetical protein
MPIHYYPRPGADEFETDVLREVSRVPHDGFLTNNVLLPNVSYRCFPNEHDALLLLPWAAYTLEAKGWDEGDYRFEGNNPIEWQRRRPIYNDGGRVRVLTGFPNPFHVAYKKATVVHGILDRMGRGLEHYPVLPLVVLPDHCTFTPDRHTAAAAGGGPTLDLRIAHLGKLIGLLEDDARKYPDLRLGRGLLEDMLRTLETLPCKREQPMPLCGCVRIEEVVRAEPGCPVRLRAYKGEQAVAGVDVEVREYLLWPFGDDTASFLEHARKRAAALMRVRLDTVMHFRHAEELPDRLVLVVDPLFGEPLETVVRQRGPLPIDLVRSLLQHLTSTVTALHEQGIVHLDIRPEYVLLDPDLEAHGGRKHMLIGLTNPLIDSGKLSTAVFQNNFEASFSAPEMWQSGQIDRGLPATDLFSLARMAVYCLLGDTRYREQVRQEEPFQFPLGDLDPTFRVVLEVAMKQRVADRFASAREMLALLGAER